MSKANKVVIIGGGASGIVAAIAAVRNGARATIIERMNRVGKKILATGNGRCNLCNTLCNPSNYHGQVPSFVSPVLTRFSVEHTIRFFEELGITCKTEENGKVYPYSDQASAVLDCLRFELEALGVEVICEAEAAGVSVSNTDFSVELRNGIKINGKRIILATGGKAAPNLGSNGSGYSLAKSLGHTVFTPFPALVQLKLNAAFLKQIDGVKFNGEASIFGQQGELYRETGEILFTDYGISGPPILQLSRMASEYLNMEKQVEIKLDMFPHLSQAELDLILQHKFSRRPGKTLEQCLIGLINKRLILVILKEAGINDFRMPCERLTTEERAWLVKLLKGWLFTIIGTQNWQQAQVTAGGVATKEINSQTMESKLVKGLYFAGEVVDIDGDCGGYNLQWAWSSGYVAGEEAAKSVNSEQ